MTGPKQTNVDRRRRRVAVFLVASAAASEDVVKRLSEKLHVGERAIRGDLDVLRDEFEAARTNVLPEDLPAAIRAASSFRLLSALGKRVMVEMVTGNMERELGATLFDGLREQRHALRSQRGEDAEAAITALEILTPQDQEVLRKYRESLIPPALKPGEFPPPPEGSPVPAAPKPPLPSLPTAGLPPSSVSS